MTYSGDCAAIDEAPAFDARPPTFEAAKRGSLDAELGVALEGALRKRGLPFARHAWGRVKRASRLDRAFAFLDAHAHLEGHAFVDAALAHFDWRYRLDPREREHVPERGRVLLVANHPLGAIDALVLLAAIADVRRDVRIVANDWLARITGLTPLLLPLRVFGGGTTRASVGAIEAALERDEAVIVFPAGEVSRLGWRGVADGAWRDGFLRFAARTGAPVVPVHVKARNSAGFYLASALAKPLGTALLAREAMRPRGRVVDLRFDAMLRPATLEGCDRDQAIALVRRRVDALADPRRRSTASPVAHASKPRDVARAIGELPLLLALPDGKEIRCGLLAPDSVVMHELARLRELTFRGVGEGTGARVDRDRYDGWYEHLVLFDPREGEIVGAYRLAHGASVLATRGVDGFYASSLFAFGDALRAKLPQAVELGRSFVQPAYRHTRALDQLWLGIGAWLSRRPDVRHLFGPVSISAALPPSARDWLVSYFATFHGLAGAAEARAPFRYAGETPSFDTRDAELAMRVLKENLRALGAHVPTLYRQYVDLCDPGGTRFLAFNVDAAFSDCVDGLVLVDLDRMKPRKRERWLPPRAGDRDAGAAAARPATDASANETTGALPA